MYKSNIKLQSQVKGVIGEMHLTERLLLLGHDVVNTNFTVKNTDNYDLLVRKDGQGKAYPLQVKTTFSTSFRIGMTHADFIDANGSFNEEKGRKLAEEKVQCSWAFVLVEGTETTPVFKIYILKRQQVIDMIVASEYWYLTDCGRLKADRVAAKGDVGLEPKWLQGGSGKQTALHTNVFPNPLTGVNVENCWENIWVD
ncbi:MAG: hypothetical protein HDR93_02390 [Bacteroides sp.]|nr:hypothetical protein [Bacteroides sp.]